LTTPDKAKARKRSKATPVLLALRSRGPTGDKTEGNGREQTVAGQIA
jgi:hypothetical protein